MTAVERFKALYANAVERICVLEEQLEQAQARIADSKPRSQRSNPGKGRHQMPTNEPGRKPAIVESPDQLPQPDTDDLTPAIPDNETPEPKDIDDPGHLNDSEDD